MMLLRSGKKTMFNFAAASMRLVQMRNDTAEIANSQPKLI